MLRMGVTHATSTTDAESDGHRIVDATWSHSSRFVGRMISSDRGLCIQAIPKNGSTYFCDHASAELGDFMMNCCVRASPSLKTPYWLKWAVT